MLNEIRKCLYARWELSTILDTVKAQLVIVFALTKSEEKCL